MTKARNVVKHRSRHWSTRLRILPQVLLFVPRWTFAAALWPVRKSLFLVDRHDIVGRASRLFSGDAPVALSPQAIIVVGQGVTFGVGIGVLDSAQARFFLGGEARQIYSLKLRSRDLFGAKIELDSESELQLLRNSIFAGIGNASEFGGEFRNVPVDPTMDSTSIETRYNQSIARIEFGANVAAGRNLVVRASGAYLR
ncbi:MAG: hypothetical protein GY811_24375 [Myxococcales bacterium]|nr:hypothetical protein [Myxococcales bacterium]